MPKAFNYALVMMLLLGACSSRGPQVSPVVSEGQTEIHDHEGSNGIKRDDLGEWWGLQVNLPIGE